MRIDVDPDRCAASGLCILAVPKVFGQADEDGTVQLRVPVPGDELHDLVRRAVSRCPSGAIRLSG